MLRISLIMRRLRRVLVAAPPPSGGALSHTLLQIGLTTPAA